MTIEIRGAEAIVHIEDDIAIKERIAKKYRNSELDKRIISRRTRTESNILRKLKENPGIPRIIEQTKNTIVMEKLLGKPISETRLTDTEQEIVIKSIAQIIHDIHSKKIVHGDLSPKNIIINKIENDKIDVYLIDFGLAQTTHRIEDKASDLWMTRETFIEYDGFYQKLLDEYLSLLSVEEKVLFEERIHKMGHRGRHRSRQVNENKEHKKQR